MTIIIEYKKDAKMLIRELFTIENKLIFNSIVNVWLCEESYRVICIILQKENKPVSFALLHKMDFDPINIYNKPVLLDFIYTFDDERNKGYASKLINKIKKNNQITGFCDSDKSISLFKKNGYSIISHIVRFPPSPIDYKLLPIINECIENTSKEDIIDNCIEKMLRG